MTGPAATRPRKQPASAKTGAQQHPPAQINSIRKRAPQTKVSLFQSLVLRSMVSICLLVTLIGAIFIQLRQEEIRKDSMRELQRSAAYLTQNLAQAFVLPGLEGDKETIRLQLQALHAPSNRNFCGAKVMDAAGNVIFNEGYPDKLATNQIAQDQFIVDMRLPKKERHVLGRFWLCTSTDAVQKKIKTEVFHELKRFAVVMLAVLVAVYTSLLFLIRPLKTVRQAMGQVAQTMKPIEDPALLRSNEVGVLSHGFNSMVEDLAETYHALEIAREQAIKSETAKSEFLANMSHELRTPLNNIIGTVQLLHDRPLEEPDRELFTIVEKGSRSLLAIVNDILDLSKIEAGEVKLEKIPFDAYEKIRDVTRMFHSQAQKKSIAISCETDLQNLYILGDPLRLERIVTNLVGNALRYTEKGSIKIVASISGGKPGAAVMRCEVRDTGIGIPKDRQQKIFERFTQADNSTSRRFGGTGLGLTITREIVILMKGRIGVESEEGKGSTFWFEMPIEASTATEAVTGAADAQTVTLSSANAKPVQDVKVLIAEDHELNRAFMRRLFEKLGISHYTFAENGRIAVDQVRAGDYDLVLMDCQMPELDGYEATAVIRGLPQKERGGIPIVAMTANAMSSDEQRCLAAGMNAYISKPFEIGTFKRTLSPWINFPAAPPAAATPGSPATDTGSAANMDILLSTAAGDHAYLTEMVALFTDTAEQLLQEMRAAPGGNDGAWKNAAHGLKGAAGIVGAENLHRLSAQAQEMDESADRRQEMLDALEREYRRVREFFVMKKLLP